MSVPGGGQPAAYQLMDPSIFQDRPASPGNGAQAPAPAAPAAPVARPETPYHPVTKSGTVLPHGIDGDSDEWPEAGEDRNADPAGVETAPEGQKEYDWDSDDNPYKQRFQQLEAQQSRFTSSQTPQARMQEITNNVETAARQFRGQFDQAVTEGKMTGQLADFITDQVKKNAILEAQMQIEHEALLPVARETAARKTAEKYTTKTVAVTAADLLGEPTVEAMEARAKTIVQERRNGNFQQRTAARTDTVGRADTTGGLDSAALAAMSPHAKIAYGLRRGQGSKP